MPVETLLIISPAIDFTTLLGLAHDALGYDIASVADASPRELSDAEKFLVCLAALKDESAEITFNLLSHVSFSVLVIAEAVNHDAPADILRDVLKIENEIARRGDALLAKLNGKK